MIERKARKEHACDDARWRRKTDQPLLCSGTIAVGEVYAEAVEWNDDVWHPPRYHLDCYKRLATTKVQSRDK